MNKKNKNKNVKCGIEPKYGILVFLYAFSSMRYRFKR